PTIADALGAVRDDSARAPLLELFAHERYETALPHEARALVALGAGPDLLPLLARFAGRPEPMVDAIAIAREARLLAPDRGGIEVERATGDLDVRLAAPGPSADAGGGAPDAPAAAGLRLLVLSAGEGGELTGTLEAQPVGPGIEAGPVHIRD